MDKYVLDACSLIAFFLGEPGADIVRDLLLRSSRGECLIFLNKINFLEIYYGFLRDDGREIAEQTFNAIRSLPLTVVDVFGDELFKEAGRLKATYQISLADSIAVAEAKVRNATLVSSDHHKFDIIEQNGEVSFSWFR